MKIELAFSDLTPEAAQRIIAWAHANVPGGAMSTAAGTVPGQPVPVQPLAPATPPRPAAPPTTGSPPLAAPPPAVAAPVAPPAAPPPMAQPPAAPGAVTHQAVLAAMQSYARVHKTAGVKAVLAQIGAAKVQDVQDQAQLKWMLDTFNAGLTKQ